MIKQRSKYALIIFSGLLIMALALSGCASPAAARMADAGMGQSPMDIPTMSPAEVEKLPAEQPGLGTPTVQYTLKTGISTGKMTFTGAGGSIDGVVDPDLKANPGDIVEITLLDGDGVTHDLTVPDLGVKSLQVKGKDATAKIKFKAEKPGTYAYYCTLPGHRQAGMEGKIIVGGASADQAAAGPTAASIVRDASDLPAPLENRGPQKVRVDLETVEVEGQLAKGVSYTYWTFNGKVPGPFIRVRVGDQVEVHLKNAASSKMAHSVDFHAVTGPGGGAVFTQTAPGQETSFTFTPQNPGLFVYHCATPSVAQHIASGMYGLILVEPAGGLPPVDHEFYVMQGEMYTAGAYGQAGHQDFDNQKMLDEEPEYYVFNGAVGALTDQHPLKAKVGETVRIYFGVGGPNETSSFHVIGEVFDRVYELGSLTSQPLTDVQTVLVPTGGAVMVEFQLQAPGRYILVDHSLARMERGLSGYLIVEGPQAPEVIQGTVPPGSGN